MFTKIIEPLMSNHAIENNTNERRDNMKIAEPVGSCTDLSATIMQPLKENFDDKLDISPLTVLVDPERLKAMLEGGTSGLHASAAYIVEKQLEEADIIVITKTDLLSRLAMKPN